MPLFNDACYDFTCVDVCKQINVLYFFIFFPLIWLDFDRKEAKRNLHIQYDNVFVLKDLLFLIVNKARFLCVCLHVAYVLRHHVWPNKKGVGLIQFID